MQFKSMHERVGRLEEITLLSVLGEHLKADKLIVEIQEEHRALEVEYEKPGKMFVGESISNFPYGWFCMSCSYSFNTSLLDNVKFCPYCGEKSVKYLEDARELL